MRTIIYITTSPAYFGKANPHHNNNRRAKGRSPEENRGVLQASLFQSPEKRQGFDEERRAGETFRVGFPMVGRVKTGQVCTKSSALKAKNCAFRLILFWYQDVILSPCATDAAASVLVRTSLGL